MKSADVLVRSARALDGKSYGAYKSLRGAYDYTDFSLLIERVQSDPFAPPSAVRVFVDLRDCGLTAAALGFSLMDEGVCGADQVAVADFLAREFARACAPTRGALRIAQPGQQILRRSSVSIHDGQVELRFQVQLPARGRRILGRAAATLFAETIPDVVFAALDFLGADASERIAQLQRHVYCYRDYLALRELVAANNWVSFIADGAVLARASGVSQEPLVDAVPFAAPSGLRTSVSLPHAGVVHGLGIERGVTVIVGGGYHGKSTLLAAIERGVWAHIPGDGRELVATVPDAFKVRAEDGRAITGTDISLFIADLPGGVATECFSTVNASGSTSQAAAIAEALEAGCSALLVDEDTSATNLMIRDQRMRELVDAEPITPLVDRLGVLRAAGVSLIVVMGGSGDYLGAADRVLLLDSYRCRDVTERAHVLAGGGGSARPLPRVSAGTIASRVGARCPVAAAAPEREKTKTSGTDLIMLDREATDVSALVGIVDPAQTEAIAAAMRLILTGRVPAAPPGFVTDFAPDTLAALAHQLVAACAHANLDTLRPGTHPAFFAEFRAADLLAALGRYRSLRLRD